MKVIIIENIPDVMFEHIVNGLAGTADAFKTLDADAQQKLVGDKIMDYCAGVAKGHAVNMAQLQAARQTAALADGMIQQTRAVVQVKVEESTS